MKLAKPQETKSTIRFSARLLRPKAAEKIESWTLLTLPRNANAELPSRGMRMVEGTINGFPFRAALEPNGEDSYSLRVNQALQGAAGAHFGDTVTVEITRVGEELETTMPMELRKALSAAPGRRHCGWISRPWRARTGFSGSAQPSCRKRACAGSRMPATSLHLERSGYVVLAV